jgi:endo-1,4-beta-xylanase
MRLEWGAFSTWIENSGCKELLMRLAAIVALALAFIANFPTPAAEDDQQRVDGICATYDKAGSPGCAVGVIRDGNFIYRRGYGAASLELGVPLSPQSVFLHQIHQCRLGACRPLSRCSFCGAQLLKFFRIILFVKVWGERERYTHSGRLETRYFPPCIHPSYQLLTKCSVRNARLWLVLDFDRGWGTLLVNQAREQGCLPRTTIGNEELPPQPMKVRGHAHLAVSFRIEMFILTIQRSYQSMLRRSFVQVSLGALAASALPFRFEGAELAKLGEIAATKGLLFGTAVSDRQLKRPEFAALLADQCSILVAENQMKWRATHPEQDHFDFSAADFFMEFAESHGLPARGHNLCWHEYNPDWLEAAATPENAVSLLRTHIQTVAGRYKGRIHSWDVVNEAIRPDHHNHNDMVNSVWLKNIGEDYVELAFRAAAKADPHALLTYNDYDIETDASEQERKRESILAMLHRFSKKRVPIHAIGVQAHLRPHGAQLTWNGLNRFLNEVRKLKLEIFVTELDVDDQEFPADIPERDGLIGEVYRSFLENIVRQKSLKAILTWCLSDRDSWLQGFRPRKDGLAQRPLPFDADLMPKPAFIALREAIAGRK